LGVKSGRSVRLTTSPPSVSPLSEKYVSLDVSQPYLWVSTAFERVSFTFYLYQLRRPLQLDKYFITEKKPRGTLYPQKLALTSSTSCSRSDGIVRSRTQATEFSSLEGRSRQRLSHRKEGYLHLNTAAVAWSVYRVPSRQGQEIFLLSLNFRSAGAHPVSYRWVPGFVYPGVTRQGSEADYSPPSGTEIKNGAIPPLLRNSSWHGD
jgi:hypothetical protein